MAAGRHRIRLTTRQRIAVALAAALIVLGIPIAVAVKTSAPAQAAAGYDNAAIADKAASYAGQWGGNACRDAHKLDGNNTGRTVARYGAGQCRTFVNCVVSLVSGGKQYPTGVSYFQSFLDAGGQEVKNPSQLAKGDIVQVGDGSHTFIIYAPVRGNLFSVVDSNSDGKSETVRGGPNDLGHTRAVNLDGMSTRAFRMGTVHGAPVTGGSGGGGGMRGSLDFARRAPGGIAVGGWSIDNDTPKAIDTHMYGGNGNPGSGNPGVALTANGARPDVARAFPGYGANHGFTGLLATDRAGTQTVCAYGINALGTPGGNDRLACKTVTVSNLPYGSLDSVAPASGGVNAYGWAIDPDTDRPIAVHLYAGDGLPRPGINPGIALTADGSRPDVANAFPGYSDRHGYGTFFALPRGNHTVCAYGINADGTPGASNPQLGCKQVVVG